MLHRGPKALHKPAQGKRACRVRAVRPFYAGTSAALGVPEKRNNALKGLRMASYDLDGQNARKQQPAPRRRSTGFQPVRPAAILAAGSATESQRQGLPLATQPKAVLRRGLPSGSLTV